MHDLRPLAPDHAFPFPPEYERNLQVLGNLCDFERRLWLQASKVTPMPRFVYRYVGYEISEKYLSDYMLQSYFYLNSVSDFNDPFDMGAYVTINPDPKKRSEKFNKILKEHRTDLNWKQRRKETSKMMLAPDQLPNIRAAYEKSIRDMGAVCFTTEPCNLLMWSHYASHHCGLALQFHAANDIRTLSRLLKVNYSDEYPIIDWVEDTKKTLESVLTTKSRHWEYEKEFRIFVVDGAKTYLPFQPKALTGLIFGCRADPQLKERVLNVLELRASKNFSPLKIYQAVKHSREYSISVQKDLSLKWPS